MANARFMIVLPLVALASAALGNAPPESSGTGKTTVSRSNNEFAVDLYGRLHEQRGNLFFSPASISTAFAMAYAGARGQTAQQIAHVLHFDQPPRELNAQYAKLLSDWNSGGKERHYQLDVANAFWGQQGYPFSAAFNQLLQGSYGAAMHAVDFRQSEAARQAINQWVARQTHEKIKDLIPSGGVDASTRLVLANAIYFKAAWDQRFMEAATQPRPFKVPGAQPVDVPMMHQTGDFRYLKGENFAALQMSYADNALLMMVFLPDRADGLSAFEQSLSADKLEQWAATLDRSPRRQVQVSFPKFRLTQEVELSSIMGSMGMPLAFSPHADFSAMNGGKEPLFINQVFHKAYVDVNEEGTEAAAATGIGIRAAAMPAHILAFNADHPFLFVIRDNRSGSILFMGRLLDPQG